MFQIIPAMIWSPVRNNYLMLTADRSLTEMFSLSFLILARVWNHYLSPLAQNRISLNISIPSNSLLRFHFILKGCKLFSSVVIPALTHVEVSSMLISQFGFTYKNSCATYRKKNITWPNSAFFFLRVFGQRNSRSGFPCGRIMERGEGKLQTHPQLHCLPGWRLWHWRGQDPCGSGSVQHGHPDRVPPHSVHQERKFAPSHQLPSIQGWKHDDRYKEVQKSKDWSIDQSGR